MQSLEQVDVLQSTRERLQAVCPDDRPQWGVMNAGEMVCHLRGAFLTAMGEMASEPVALPLPRAAVKAMALWAPVPWKRNFQTLPALRVGTPAMRPGVFETDRAELFSALDRFCEPGQRRVDHAFFGPMSSSDWMRWGYLHTDHHLRQFGR